MPNDVDIQKPGGTHFRNEGSKASRHHYPSFKETTSIEPPKHMNNGRVNGKSVPTTGIAFFHFGREAVMERISLFKQRH
jgi:hypothetical protein